RDRRGQQVTDDSLLLLFNGQHEALDWTLPKQWGEWWDLIVDTAAPEREGEQAGSDRYLPVAARSVVLLMRKDAPASVCQAGRTKDVGPAAARCLQWGHDRQDRDRASYMLAGCRCLNSYPLATGDGSPACHRVSFSCRASGPFPVPSSPKGDPGMTS